jgi:hypothetical protein
VHSGHPVRVSVTAKPDGSQEMAPASFQERHYTVAEIAETWNLSRDSVRKIFEDEAGVLVLGAGGSERKRGYHTLRIPQSVVERVHRRLSNPDLLPAASRGVHNELR